MWMDRAEHSLKAEEVTQRGGYNNRVTMVLARSGSRPTHSVKRRPHDARYIHHFLSVELTVQYITYILYNIWISKSQATSTKYLLRGKDWAFKGLTVKLTDNLARVHSLPIWIPLGIQSRKWDCRQLEGIQITQYTSWNSGMKG